MKRQIAILEYLIQRGDYASIETLGKRFHVSTRTIREDIKNLEDLLQNIEDIKIIRNRNKGVSVVLKETKDQILKKVFQYINENNIYYSEEQRVGIILFEILTQNHKITYAYLMEKTGVSKTTILHDVSKCEEWLFQHNISLIKKTRTGIQIQYRELDLRNACLDYIETFVEDENNLSLFINNSYPSFLTLNLSMNKYINSLKENINIVGVNNFIRKTEALFEIRLSEVAFKNIFYYILIMANRILSRHSLNMICDTKHYHYDESEELIVQWILEEKPFLEEMIKEKINDDEFYYLFSFIMSQNKRYLNKIIDTKKALFGELSSSFIDGVQTQLCINLFNDRMLYENIASHISSTRHRLLSNIKVKNPFRAEIIKNYPEVFQACKISSRLIENEFKRKLSDDEVSFLALHIAASLEKNKKNYKHFQNINTLIVCSNGIGTSNMLKTRVANEFSELSIINIVSVQEYTLMDLKKVDLVLTTVPLPIEEAKKVIQVSPLLIEEDIIHIQQFINEKFFKKQNNFNSIIKDLMGIISKECIINDYGELNRKIQQYFLKNAKKINNKEKLLSNFAIPEHIKIGVHIKDAQEAIMKSAELMHKTGSVDKIYGNLMLQAKEVLGANIVIAEGIAFPHAKSNGTVKKSSMTFMLLDEPIKFGNEAYDPVSFVISLAATDQNEHIKAMSELVRLIDNDKVLNKLMSAKNSSEFRSILISFERQNNLI